MAKDKVTAIQARATVSMYFRIFLSTEEKPSKALFERSDRRQEVPRRKQLGISRR